MPVPIRIVLVSLACLLAARGYAQDAGPNPLAALRDNRWADAQAAASRFADPVPEKIVLYYRLRAAGAATAAEIADFMQRNPDWPAQALLERRRQEAIAQDPDDAAVLIQCNANLPTLGGAMLRCAEALANAGHVGEANEVARRAWIGAVDDAGMEATFLRRWAGVPTVADQWERFQRLAWTDPPGAVRQMSRLNPQYHAAAEARLAVKRDDPHGEALVASLPPALRDDPGLMLDRARSLRRMERVQDALALWLKAGGQAQRDAPAHMVDFWAERNLLARRLLRDGDKTGAYSLVEAHGQTSGEALADAEFLAGFIALRQIHDPTKAADHFSKLAAASPAAITQGRAHYWLGRTAAAAASDPKPDYAKAASWPTTYYGQLAALELGDTQTGLMSRIKATRDPAWTPETAQAFAGHEVLRAGAWLIAWGDPARARIFLQRMDELAPIPAERALTAAFATQVGMPDSAVSVARRMGRDGLMLPQLGWPAPFTPPTPPDTGFSLGIMRQESSFDVAAVSPSGARGLMQLMPPTASSVAKQLGIPVAIPSLTVDAGLNMHLGTAYLQQVLGQFGATLPLAAAAYNAGPHRVSQWLDDYGDPRAGPIDMVDWIELIPLNETRNYVQRVMENTTIYRARSNDPTPLLTVPWTR